MYLLLVDEVCAVSIQGDAVMAFIYDGILIGYFLVVITYTTLIIATYFCKPRRMQMAGRLI